jgi:glycosyltransferase involved in cell wall biosynthesis
MTISVSIIVKNEESCIRQSLDSVKDFDEIVIIDTGSTDQTVSICQEYTDKVYYGPEYQWQDNFAYHRNQSLSKCTGDWVYIIDADEQVEPGTYKHLKDLISSFNDSVNAIEVKTIAMLGKEFNWSVRCFKRIPEIKWMGSAHNYLVGVKPYRSSIKHYYGYSSAHALDPDRTLRILKKTVENTPELTRERYYLAREYWYRKDYQQALFHYDEYLKRGTFIAEVADAWLMKARCLWYLQRGEEARQACLQAIYCNPEFKEALQFMAEMTYEPRKSSWFKMANAASNRDVLFVRT